MGKFKVGDRVRLTVDSDMASYGLAPGDTGTVLEDSSAPFIRWDKKTEFNWAACDFELELAPTITIESGKHYRTRSGKPTGRVTVGFGGFEAVVDGRVRIFDKAGGAVHGDDDIVEAWVPKVGERVRFVRDNPNGGSVFGAAGDIVEIAGEGSESTAYGDQVEIAHPGFSWKPGAPIAALEPLPVAPQPVVQEPAALKIEAGRYYKTRDGRKVGPLMTTDNNEYWPFKWPEQTMYYRADGYSCPGAKHLHRDQDDLIAEWQETTNVGAQVDTLAEEYGAAPNDRKLLKTGQGYGYELARFGGYVWVDIGKTAPITIRADKIAA